VVRNSSKFHHVANAHVGVGHPVLLNEGDPAGKLLFGDAGDVLPVQRHAARIRATQAREDTQKRRFTAAVWAQQADGFPRETFSETSLTMTFLPTFQVIFSAQILITYSLSGR
jgi:hypothetical protein